MLLAFAAIVVLVIVARFALSAWVDLLWFGSLGYAEVFWKTWAIQIVLFFASAGATFALLFSLLAALRRALRTTLPLQHSIVVNGQPIALSVEPVVRVVSLLVPVVGALIAGTSMASDWQTFALLRYAPHAASGVTDPVFGRPLEFFLCVLPALQAISSWLVTLAVVGCLCAAAFVTLAGGFRALSRQSFTGTPSPWRPLSATLAALLAAFALNVFLGRYTLALEHHTLFDGITYTDAHIWLPGLTLVSVALLLGVASNIANAASPRPRARTLMLSVVPPLAVYLVLAVVGWYTASFIVKPNELDRESPWIAHNIEMTRRAFGLDRFRASEFPAETTLDAADPANNQPTLQNIRLWDWRALQDTLRQVQEIRTYYDFPDVDIDRYVLNGTQREVMLAPRELNIDKLPSSSRNWINEKLIYTHGYGITMNSVNGFTPEGLPTFLLRDMPVQSTVPGLTVTRPEIYFGDGTDTDVYVKTHQQEFNYPQGQSNNLTSYEGAGGIEVGGFVRRVLLAFERDDLGKLPFSDDVTPTSRLLMRRNVRARIATLAPFLTYENDPYMVVGDDGRLVWMMDAFTTSDEYPDANHHAMGDTQVNYVRNSVKVVVDAYSGAVTFYVFDPTDPVIAAYRKIFPTLFHDATAMPADLRRHIRYPELLLKLQADMYGLYHMTKPEVFFNREDLWTIATQTSSDANGQQVVEPMQPNFVLMKLPGEAHEEFVGILPFTPANRNNLIGWIAARCDGDHYGTAVVYDFPKSRLVDGPQQIEARIDQNAELSGQLTLWNQQGSHVIRGSLLVIPSGHALLYAEPIYLQAQQSPMPELRLVVLALQDKLAYAPTFDAALIALFGSGTPSLAAAASPAAPSAGAQSDAAVGAKQNIGALITQAGQEFRDYQSLTAAGKMSDAGRKLDELKVTLEKLNAQKQ